MRNTAEKGSMLIELMIVISIIAILSGVTLPWYGTYVRKTHVAGGLKLSQPAKLRTAELVNSGDLTEDGIAAGGYWGCNEASTGSSECSATPGKVGSSWEYVAVNPSPMVRSVLRIGTVVIVNFSSQFDPQPYSVVLNGSLVDGHLTWQCLSGDAAKNILGAANGAGATVGKELPPSWAPATCVG